MGVLRRLLEPGLAARETGRWLIRSAGGYRLDVDAGTADLLRFRQLAEQARWAVDDGGTTAGVRLLAQALELWQGPAANGIGPEVRGHPVFTALDQEYLAVAREAADLALSAGAPERLLSAMQARAAEQGPLG